MVHGAILPGEQWFNEEHWVEDILGECYFDDCLWGYILHMAEELHTCGPTVFTDGVLFDLMQMGTVNWRNENSWNNQSTQAMCLATTLASCLICIINMDRANVSGG